MTSLIHKIKMHGIRKFVRYGHIEARAKWYRLLYSSMSQCQEDLTIDRLLQSKPRGFYVDIGAANGLLYSNTYYFYRKGWRGINIEPDPDNFAHLIHNRPEDLNVPLGVDQKSDSLTLYRFSPGVLSTFSETVAQEFRSIGYEFTGKTTVTVDTLAHILDTYAPSPDIDFFSIDTEGYDLVILQSNNWSRYKPRLICVELEYSHKNPEQADNELHTYLSRLHYRLCFDNRVNRIYQLESH